MARAKVIDWGARHTPVTGTLNASYTVLAVAAVGQQTGLPGSWVLGASAVGAIGSLISGGSREPRLSNGSLILRASAWLAGGGWASYALSEPDMWSWGVVAPLLAMACGFGSAAGGLAYKERKQLERNAAAAAALFRVKTGHEWSDRFERVANVAGCSILGVEEWTDSDGNKTGAGFTLEVQLPQGGATWKNLQAHTEQFAADAQLPEGCGVEVFSGKGRGLAIVKVSIINALLETIDVPLNASEMDFNQPFDIGVLRDSLKACIDIREFSGMLVGDKRTGKTNELQAIITRLVRMPNLLIWVIDFNGGGVALPWLQAWDELGRPGRPPIDWVASNDKEALEMAKAAVRIAKARKIKYQRHMREHNTDLLPLTADIPGILIITDEGAEVYADPKRRHIAEAMKEVLRIAGAVGVNQMNCFLRATADVTGDTLIKSQSRARIGMRMAVEEDIAYLFGWRCGVKPEDMPDRGYGAVSMDPAGSADIFRGYRVLPNHINWFVEHTAKYRQNKGMDVISFEEAGDFYSDRWSPERSGYIFDGSTPPASALVPERDDEAEEDGTEAGPWASRPAVTADEARANLRKAIEDNGGPTVGEQNEFDAVLAQAGVTDWGDPSQWPDGVKPEAATPAEPESESIRDVMFGLIKAMGSDGITPKEIMDALTGLYGEAAPVRATVMRWLREDDRITKPSYGKYAVKEEGEDDGT